MASPTRTGPLPVGSFTEALRTGWRTFERSPGSWIASEALLIGVSAPAIAVLGAAFPTWIDSFNLRMTPGHLIPEFVSQVVISLAWVCLASASLHAVDHQRLEFGDGLEILGESRAWVVAVILATAGTALALLPILSGLPLPLLFFYVPFFVADGRSIRSSLIDGTLFFFNNFLARFALLLIATTVLAFGAFFCGVGILVTIPVATVAIAWSYRLAFPFASDALREHSLDEPR